ncbi:MULTISPECIES: glycosyltransferase [Pectobacterium]|uniref:glycosyltransferase n=1 Tax=Pectobacterium TaxID=122277 RepID=UPI0010FE42D4|nr:MULTISPECIES: glycosyltransferase [Pectobacterium]KAA3667404.1 glycosyltransferase family 2 protein [Pectobacterium carotovorum subsp. carotovorum]MCA6925188.1 glycosyltransferase family 2 protein [Pectobacterium versatile]MCH5081948.1 glycosyltransferase [Pectobacterium versatile]
MEFSIIIPTYNAGSVWEEVIDSIGKQFSRPNRVIVIDSSSTDNTAILAKEAGFDVYHIDKSTFDHGGTRSMALEKVSTEFVIYMTQDAILQNDEAFFHLLSAFNNEDVGAVYGRQLAHHDANPLAAHARLHSYGEVGYVTSMEDDFPQGFRKVFMSNSFSGYRVSTLRQVGGFPAKLILGEDSYVAARMLSAGMRVAYMPKALVRHSHNYSVGDEFKRYFDIGVFHKTQEWMLASFGKVEGEGVKFARGQIYYLLKNNHYHYILFSVASSGAKYLGYKLGKNYHHLNRSLCKKLSMYKSYWNFSV